MAKDRVVSAKVSADEKERIENATHILHKEGKISRCTPSSYTRKAVMEYTDKVLEEGTEEYAGKNEKISMMEKKAQQMENKNRKLTNELNQLLRKYQQLEQGGGDLHNLLPNISGKIALILRQDQQLISKNQAMERMIDDNKFAWDAVKAVKVSETVLQYSSKLGLDPFLFTSFFLEKWENMEKRLAK